MHDPFFIVGCGRSGTTLLRLMLTAHPNLSVPPEGDFLLGLDGQFDDPTDPTWASRFVDAFFSIEKCREWGLEPATLSEGIASLAPTSWPELAAVPYWAYLVTHDPEANRWGDKNPGYVSHVPRLLQLYPRARVIHLVRDGRDVAQSWLSVHFGPRSLEQAARRWASAVAVGNRIARLHPRSVVEVHYEALVADPEGELRRICTFLGEDFDPAMLGYDRLNRERGLVPAHRLAWHANTLGPPDPSRIGRGRAALSVEDAALFDRLAGPVLEANGYRRSGPDGPPSRDSAPDGRANQREYAQGQLVRSPTAS